MTGDTCRRKILLQTIVLSLLCVIPAMAAAGCGSDLRKPPAVLAAAGETGAYSIDQSAADNDEGVEKQKLVKPEQDPFNPLVQAPVETGAAPSTPAIGDATTSPPAGPGPVEKQNGGSRRDPFEPLVVAYASENSTKTAGETTGNGDSPAIVPEDRMPVAGGPELVTTYIENGENHAYFSHQDNFYDVREGESFNGYRVLNINPAGGRVTLDKDGRVIILTAKGSIK
jgi:hypothetical protein